MKPFLTGFSTELMKLSAPIDPTAKADGKMEKLLQGGLEAYVGSKDIRTPTFPSMREVASQPSKEQKGGVDVRPPKPPKVK